MPRGELFDALLRDLVRFGGSGGKLEIGDIDLLLAGELRQQNGNPARDDDEHRGDGPAATAIARPLLAYDLRTQLVDLRQHARIDFFELAHRARGRRRLIRHQRRREVVGGGGEDRGFAFRGDVGRGAFESERVLEHRVHFIGDVPHRRRALAPLLG